MGKAGKFWAGLKSATQMKWVSYAPDLQCLYEYKVFVFSLGVFDTCGESQVFFWGVDLATIEGVWKTETH